MKFLGTLIWGILWKLQVMMFVSCPPYCLAYKLNCGYFIIWHSLPLAYHMNLRSSHCHWSLQTYHSSLNSNSRPGVLCLLFSFSLWHLGMCEISGLREGQKSQICFQIRHLNHPEYSSLWPVTDLQRDQIPFPLHPLQITLPEQFLRSNPGYRASWCPQFMPRGEELQEFCLRVDEFISFTTTPRAVHTPLVLKCWYAHGVCFLKETYIFA